MTSTNQDKKTLEWAVKIFRPLMKKLDIQHVIKQNYITTSSFREMFRHHMDNAVIIVHRCSFSNSEHKGVFIWQYIEKNKIYVLHILLNDDLYTKTSSDAGIKRKAVSTHEFTHCVAALMSSAELATDLLIKNQMSKLKKSFHALQEADIQKILSDIKKETDTSKECQYSFNDEHFRTGDENFQSSYADLYVHLLLSYDLFREYFTDEKMIAFFTALLANKFDEVENIISKVVEFLVKEKQLDIDFVKKRINEELLKKAAVETYARKLLPQK